MNCSLKFTVKLSKGSALSNLVCLHQFKHSISESDLLKNFLFPSPSPPHFKMSCYSLPSAAPRAIPRPPVALIKQAAH